MRITPPSRSRSVRAGRAVPRRPRWMGKPKSEPGRTFVGGSFHRYRRGAGSRLRSLVGLHPERWAAGRAPRALRRTLIALAGMAALGVILHLASAAAELAGDSRLLRVRRVTVRGNTYLTDEAILKRMGDPEGQGLLDVEPKKLEARLLAHPRLKSAHVSRTLDGRLAVEVVERRAVALIEAGVLLEVDAEGMVLPPVERGALPDVPILAGMSGRAPAPGTRVKSPAVLAALGLIGDLAQSDPEFLAGVSQIDMSRSPVLRLSLVGRPAVVVVHAESVSSARLAGLRSVLDDLERRGRRRVEVDLRFEGQLVVRELK